MEREGEWEGEKDGERDGEREREVDGRLGRLRVHFASIYKAVGPKIGCSRITRKRGVPRV